MTDKKSTSKTEKNKKKYLCNIKKNKIKWKSVNLKKKKVKNKTR